MDVIGPAILAYVAQLLANERPSLKHKVKGTLQPTLEIVL